MTDSISPQKQCSKCKEFLPATKEYFHANKATKDGFAFWCKTCRTTYNKVPPEKNRITQRKYDAVHKEEKKQYHQATYKAKTRVPQTKKHHHQPARNKEYYQTNKNVLVADGYQKMINCNDHFTSEHWKTIKKLCNYTCLCCGKKEPEIKLCADHIIPRSRGGLNIVSNIQPLCIRCNVHKMIKSTDYRPKIT